jgi:hypothetical protein
MAKSRNNVITHGLSGKIADLLIFRQRNGQTIVSKVPEHSKKSSEKQIQQRKRFQQATIYAKIATETPGIKELYAGKAKKLKDMTAYSVAVADFFNAPDIETVDLSAYTGAVGDEIRIITSDDFAVKTVHIQISNADGSPVEEGYAVNSIGNLWIYTATTDNESLEGDKIVVSVSDMPGNISTESYEA